MLKSIFYSDLPCALQINSYSTDALAAGRREVTDIMKRVFCHARIYNAPAPYYAPLRHGCLTFAEQK